MRTGAIFKATICLAAIFLPAAVLAEETPSPTPSPQAENPEKPDELAEEMLRNQEQISAKRQEIEDLNRKINELRAKRSDTAAEAELIASQVAKIESSLKKAELELSRTKLSISKVKKEQSNTAVTIEELQGEISGKQTQLRGLVRLLYEKEQTPLISIFFTTNSLSSVIAEQNSIQKLQQMSLEIVNDLRRRETELSEKQKQLEQQEEDLDQLEAMQALQQEDLAGKQAEQAAFLKAKQAEQVKYEQLIAEAKQAREEIESDIFTLKNAGVKLSLTEATDIARYAGKLTGIRPAVLLGVLKIETNLGTNLGSGKFPDDMHPKSREPFLRITKKLGLDPNTAPISARPKSYSGWGGAMGPGQFMPHTWETIEGRVASLVGKPLANPYELTDAFVATAIFLADRGATDPAKEYEAVNRYLAGPNWQRFTWYGDRVMAVAKEYEKAGL